MLTQYKKRSAVTLLIIVTGFADVYSQTPEKELTQLNRSKKFSVYIYGTYVSGAELQNSPRSTDPIERDATVEMRGGYGYGGEFLYDPGIYNVGIKFYVSSEYLKVNENDLEMVFDNGASTAKIRMNEQYTFVPLEFGLKWNLPVSSENLQIYIGGGAGVYFGDRKRRLGELQSETIFRKADFSLNILSGLEYFAARNLSADLELKFREASFDVESKFNKNEIEINNTSYPLINPFYSRIIVDGVRISLGFKYHF